MAARLDKVIKSEQPATIATICLVCFKPRNRNQKAVIARAWTLIGLKLRYGRILGVVWENAADVDFKSWTNGFLGPTLSWTRASQNATYCGREAPVGISLIIRRDSWSTASFGIDRYDRCPEAIALVRNIGYALVQNVIRGEYHNFRSLQVLENVQLPLAF